MNKLKAITFTNYGYIGYTKNLLNSIKSNSINLDTVVYTTDEKTKKAISSFNFEVIKINSNVKVSNKYFKWKAGKNEFGVLMIKKFESIFHALNNNELVLYIDGDIVIKQEIENYLLENIKNNDFLFQLDYNPKVVEQEEACAGFMLIKSNSRTKEFFNPKNINLEYISSLPSHDQTYINLNKNKFNYEFLPLSEFPNGSYFYNFECTPKIIHFNYVIGRKKKYLMKRFNEWYI